MFKSDFPTLSPPFCQIKKIDIKKRKYLVTKNNYSDEKRSKHNKSPNFERLNDTNSIKIVCVVGYISYIGLSRTNCTGTLKFNI
jgi:hypothetical protein